MERLVWQYAERLYRDKLSDILTTSMADFRRSPGLDGVTRVYVQDVGEHGLIALRTALANNPRIHALPVHGGFELRCCLRSHLLHSLRKRLMDDEHSTGRMRDEHFSTDLGL